MTETTIFQELASTVGKQKGEAAMNLSDTAAGFVTQTTLGFTFRTHTNILVLPLNKILEVFYLFIQLGFTSSNIKHSDTQQPRRLWIY